MPIVPGARYEPVPSHSGPMTAHLGLVLHIQVGNGDCYGEFDVPANQASSTWWVAKDGTLVQYVDSDLAAWTEAAGNFTWDSVETEGLPSEALTNPQIATLARLYVWGHRTYDWPITLSENPTTPGFGWHGMGKAAWGGHLDCPGEIRKAQRGAILSSASQIITPPHPLPPESHDMDDNTFVRWCYMSILLRPVDAIGFSTNMAWLTAGGARSQVYTNLCDSAEGQHVTAQRRKSLGL
jgi:hypothetical protein